ncbi:MAG TPA: DUF3426 domain-containing protein, partial [Burkholderiales bacterium]|nr:DUF3426 domain-containing protein [Burkholderiales bacterium]
LEAGVPPPLAETGNAALQARDTAVTPAHGSAPGFTPVSWPMLPDTPEVPVPLLPAELAAQTPVAPNESEMHDGAPQAALDGDPSALVEPTRRYFMRWLWPAAAALAAVVLCGQMLYGFRSEIAAYFPRLRPALAQLCGWARCSVPPLQLPSALTIQASDLLILDKGKPHLVQLIVTLQNQSTLDVGYPAIDLVLNDRFDHAVARRVFLPADYLRGAEAKKTAIAASVTTTVRIDLDLSELSAGGFGLLLIPAPQT